MKTYGFQEEAPPPKRRHRRSESDGSSSLAYSAESSDSSAFGHLMQVLDVQDTAELAAYLQKRKDERSVAGESLAYSINPGSTTMESLAYSEDYTQLRSLDGGSALHGTDLLSTITGLNPSTTSTATSDPVASDGSTLPERQDDLDILFSPAEHTDSMKKRKDRKKQKRQQRVVTPPSPRPTEQLRTQDDTDDDVWYAKWWMFCFPDVQTMTPKR